MYTSWPRIANKALWRKADQQCVGPDLTRRMEVSRVNRWIYTALYYKPFISKEIWPQWDHTDLPPTYEPQLPLLPSRMASLPFGWYSLHLPSTPTKWWPGWVDGVAGYTPRYMSRTGNWTWTRHPPQY